MNNIFYAVIVLYNLNLDKSVTYNNLKKIKGHDIRIIVADNSTEKNSNELLCMNNNCMYLNMGGNVGLSKAYNRVLDKLKGKNGIIIWFDDDTNISQEYFDELAKNEYERNDIDIFAPIICGQDGKFYSPNEARFFKNKQLKNANDELNMKKFNAINSCTAVRLRVYENYRYNEKIFLDQVDHNFFEDQRELNRTFFKIPIVIDHNFSLKTKQESINKCWKRYEIMIPDFLMYCSRSKTRSYLGVIKVMGWGIRESINYKNPIFILWCINKIFRTIKK